jgi:hypothetical protein
MAKVMRVIQQVYREHAHQRPEINATFIADQAMQAIGFAPDQPGYAEEHRRYRAAAADWLHYKFNRRREMDWSRR